MKLLNLGCGNRFHPEWINIDFNSTNKRIIAHNLLKGIPLSDESVDGVYHSHVLEHLTKNDAVLFLKECYRVLKPGGIIRIAVPDLEKIASLYIKALKKAKSGSRKWMQNYEWIKLELYDQAIRTKSGGDMIRYLAGNHEYNFEFIKHRCGVEIVNLINFICKNKNTGALVTTKFSVMKKLIEFFTHSPHRFLRELIIKILLGNEYSALQIGRFRTGGEVHQWMYDRYSLGELLKNIGFNAIKQRRADTSYVTDWSKYQLDTEPDGTIYKPDSLFMEAKKTLQ